MGKRLKSKKKVTITIETKTDEDDMVTGYCVTVKAGILNKQEYYSDTIAKALAKSFRKLRRELLESNLANDLCRELRSEGAA